MGVGGAKEGFFFLVDMVLWKVSECLYTNSHILNSRNIRKHVVADFDGLFVSNEASFLDGHDDVYRRHDRVGTAIQQYHGCGCDIRPGSGMTVEKCVAFARKHAWQYVGVEAGRCVLYTLFYYIFFIISSSLVAPQWPVTG